MEKTEYNDIKFIELMNEIKATIKNSGFPIDYQKSYEIDQQIKPIVDTLYKKDKELPKDFKEIAEGIGNSNRALYYYYFALYQDNVELLKVLSKNDNWDNNSIRDSLFLLDKNLSSIFPLKHYLFLIKYSKDEMYNFYEEVNSTIPNNKVNHDKKKGLLREMNTLYQRLFQDKSLSIEDKEIFLQRLKEIAQELKQFRIDLYQKWEKEMAYGQFSKILQTSPFVCKKKEIDQYGRNVYSNILSPYIMEVFGVQGILNLSEKQKQILSQIDCRDKKTIYRVKLFMEKNPN